MEVRIKTKGITTACEELNVELSNITTEVIKSLEAFQYFINTPYEKHLNRGLYKKVFYFNNGWDRVMIHIFKSKKEMESFDLNGGIEIK
jgi:hypothetical protein